MIDRTVRELMRRVQVDLLTTKLRIDRQPDLRILQLIAKTERPALLVVAATPPDAPRDRLIAQPVVRQVVDRRFGRLDAMRGQLLPPRPTHLSERAVHRFNTEILVERRINRLA